MPGEVGNHEQQISQFFLHLILCQPVPRFGQFVGLFCHLGQHIAHICPVETNACCAFLQLVGAQQGRQVGRDPFQSALSRLVRTFGGFDGFPVPRLLVDGFVPVFVAKHMRMPRDHLVGHSAHDVLKVKMPRLLRHLRMEHGLKQQIAQFTFELLPGAPVDGVGNFIGFLDRVGGDRGEILLNIPRAPCLRITQTAHDFKQPFDTGICVVDQRSFEHCSGPRIGVRCT